ncbi:MAG: hypothetical protein FWB91_06375 [Defluviitaleaceae bacterium]|nr:hypothetical protein [Defluviitaleaceae bacterium]
MPLEFNLDKWESEIDGQIYKFRYYNTDENHHVINVNGEIFPTFHKSFEQGFADVGYDFQFDGRDAVLVIRYGEAADVAINGVLLRSGRAWSKPRAFAWVWPAAGFLLMLASVFFMRGNPAGYIVNLIGLLMTLGVFNLPGMLRKLFRKIFQRSKKELQ